MQKKSWNHGLPRKWSGTWVSHDVAGVYLEDLQVQGNREDH